MLRFVGIGSLYYLIIISVFANNNCVFFLDARADRRGLVFKLLIMGTISYDVIATKIVSTLLPNNLMFFIVKIIMKIISSDIT